MPTFRTIVQQAEDMGATGIEVPEKVIAQLGPGKRHKVNVSINGHTYRSTVGVYGGRYMLPLAKEHRDKAGVAGGQKIEVNLELDTAAREVEVPKDFAAALK